jgi:N-acetylneuraminate synthase
MLIRLGSRWIGGDNAVYIIAEASIDESSHLESAMEKALESRKAGADAVKFRYVAEEPGHAGEEARLTIEDNAELKRYCNEIGIEYLGTPSSWQGAQELEQLGAAAFPIGCGEMTDISLLRRIAGFGKPMLVAVGSRPFEEIDRTYLALTALNSPLVLMNGGGPTDIRVNLAVLSQMMNRYPRAIVGHSDPTPDSCTCFAAAALGAKLIEKQLLPATSLPMTTAQRELGVLVEGVRKIEAALRAA